MCAISVFTACVLFLYRWKPAPGQVDGTGSLKHESRG